MNQSRIIGIALLVVGVGLMYFGYQATGSLGEEVHETITGRFTDETTWYLLGGGAMAVVGLLLTLSGGRGR
ncbi:hypothetical protein CWI75_16145 [Kineobactrum sediminis]|uniref:DUF3185 domain-containing protein n=1 Tax=Kineobactrum sediminis TaxID=1905677 RepID=A0A2N5XZ13_9GAMM|nr:DUF3185 family protein [Kineobactrum sediminis]PLW81363.1 hypothetical protein CWI75_16145 [Kineobactrum sediminis]